MPDSSYSLPASSLTKSKYGHTSVLLLVTMTGAKSAGRRGTASATADKERATNAVCRAGMGAFFGSLARKAGPPYRGVAE